MILYLRKSSKHAIDRKKTHVTAIDLGKDMKLQQQFGTVPELLSTCESWKRNIVLGIIFNEIPPTVVSLEIHSASKIRVPKSTRNS